jgi:hypothetical protein
MTDKSKKQSKRDQIRQRQRRQQTSSRMIFTAVAVAVVAGVGYLLFSSGGPDAPEGDVGQSVQTMPDSGHVEEGTDVDYNTDPPTSGPHYAGTLPAGFYNPGDINVLFPESFIMHSLEHGYVVFWYNCTVLDAAGCEQLKAEIQAVLDLVGTAKVIVFPWSSIQEPLVMTSWGQILRFNTFDADLAADYVLANRSNPRAPEPNVP